MRPSNKNPFSRIIRYVGSAVAIVSGIAVTLKLLDEKEFVLSERLVWGIFIGIAITISARIAEYIWNLKEEVNRLKKGNELLQIENKNLQVDIRLYQSILPEEAAIFLEEFIEDFSQMYSGRVKVYPRYFLRQLKKEARNWLG